MTQPSVSHEETRVSKRSRPIRGGKSTCAHCDEKRLPGTPYCRMHKIIADRAWRAKRTALFRRLRAIAEGVKT